jgi:hypothetical protein
VGLEPVPLIEDLYDDRLAAADCWLTLVGIALVIGGELAGVDASILLGGALATLGFAVFAANMAGVVVRHGPESLRIGALGGASGEAADTDPDEQFP